MLKINNNLQHYKNLCEAVKRFNLICTSHLYYYMYMEHELQDKYLNKYNDVHYLKGVNLDKHLPMEHKHHAQQQSFIRRIKNLAKFDTEYGRIFNLTTNQGIYYISLTMAGERLTAKPKAKEYKPSLNQCQHYDLIAKMYLNLRLQMPGIPILTDLEVKNQFSDRQAKPDLLLPTQNYLIECEKTFKGSARTLEKITNLENSYPGFNMIWVTGNQCVINFLNKYNNERNEVEYGPKYKLLIKKI